MHNLVEVIFELLGGSRGFGGEALHGLDEAVALNLGLGRRPRRLELRLDEGHLSPHY